MFPEYSKTFESNDVFGANGFDKIPVYRKIEVIEPLAEYIASSVKTLGENSCGYIDKCVINYHLCDKDSYFINMDNKYVFAYFKNAEFCNNIPVMMLLEFLKYKADRILLVYEDTHFLIEKTEDTYKVCEKLDEIYMSPSYLFNIIIKAVGEESYENMFYKLLEIFSMKYLNKDIRNYVIIDILLKVLKLDVV